MHTTINSLNGFIIYNVFQVFEKKYAGVADFLYLVCNTRRAIFLFEKKNFNIIFTLIFGSHTSEIWMSWDNIICTYLRGVQWNNYLVSQKHVHTSQIMWKFLKVDICKFVYKVNKLRGGHIGCWIVQSRPLDREYTKILNDITKYEILGAVSEGILKINSFRKPFEVFMLTRDKSKEDAERNSLLYGWVEVTN